MAKWYDGRSRFFTRSVILNAKDEKGELEIYFDSNLHQTDMGLRLTINVVRLNTLAGDRN